MLRLFNRIITTAPKYEKNDLVGFPINAILDWPMGTPAGLAMFCDPRVNDMFKKMFYAWSTFLTSSDSRYVLSEDEDGGDGEQRHGGRVQKGLAAARQGKRTGRTQGRQGVRRP